MAGLAPCERVFHAQVCALQITHISILAARQRQCHDGRACAPVSVCSTLWCVHFSAHMHTHLSILVAHQRQRHDGGTCPLRACVPRSSVCASNRTQLYSRSTSKTVPRCERVARHGGWVAGARLSRVPCREGGTGTGCARSLNLSVSTGRGVRKATRGRLGPCDEALCVVLHGQRVMHATVAVWQGRSRAACRAGGERVPAVRVA